MPVDAYECLEWAAFVLKKNLEIGPSTWCGGFHPGIHPGLYPLLPCTSYRDPLFNSIEPLSKHPEFNKALSC